MEKACTSLFGSVPLWFSPGKREPNRKFTESEKVKAPSLHLTVLRLFFFFYRIFADFFPPFTLTCNFVHLVLAKVTNESACAGLSSGLLVLFCSDCFQHRGRMFSVCLSGVGQVLLLKVLFIKSVNSVPGRSCLPLCCVRCVHLTGWWNQINWFSYERVIGGV